MKKLSFVIPCYRSENSITAVVSEIDDALRDGGYQYEIILVNDNSPDDVWSVICDLCEKRDDVIGLNLAKNFGQHSALMAGYRHVTGDYVFTMDDDGQTPAEAIPILLSKLMEGFDVVYGKYEERKDSTFRKLGSRFNNYMMEKMIGKPKEIHLTSFFVARRFVIDKICEYHNPFPYIWGLVVRTTHNIANVTITHRERSGGDSGYTLRKLLHLWVNGLTAFSVKPLRVASMFGMLVSVVGFFALIYTIVDRILNPDMPPGYSAMMSAILIVGGVLMILLGMLGEYIGRIYICINDSPQYVIRDSRGVIYDRKGKDDGEIDSADA
ncbi:MAG: glycosyltransferase family 2 protein [Lachnospiraceae bacterium]|jgi:undecaprenyl-phosphate 4-deoxy-4-formamido-L-arabinose transferase|nr:glycosyltransferase family 2 protein [Lachnospiraceae bacterium]